MKSSNPKKTDKEVKKELAQPPADSTHQPLKVEIISNNSWRETAISYSAIIIAVISLVVSIWQGYIGRQHNHLSVRPLMTIKETFNSPMNIRDNPNAPNEIHGLEYSNYGLGVAIINHVFVYVDNKLVGEANGNWWTPTKKAAGLGMPIPVIYEFFKGAIPVEPNTPKPLLIWRHDRDYPDTTHEAGGAFYNLVKERIGFQMSYKSLYGEEWRLIYSHGKTKIDQRKAGTQILDE